MRRQPASSRRALGLELDDDTYNIGETSTLPYAVRVTGPAEMRVFLKLDVRSLGRGRPARAAPGALYDALLEVYPGLTAADSVFQTTLQNGNPVIHPAVTLLNAALIERTGGEFDFYEEGVTESVGRPDRGRRPRAPRARPRRSA